jgi:hypothetical protein
MNEFSQEARRSDAKLRLAVHAWPQFGSALRSTFGPTVMKVYQEVQLTLQTASEDELVAVARSFCQHFRSWEWPEDETGSPALFNDNSSFSVLFKEFDPAVSPLVHVAKEKPNVFRVSNVAPREVTPNKIAMDDYNMIAKRFGLDFRAFTKAQSLGISVYIPNAVLGLRQIIKSKPARIALEEYLSYPLRGHEYDDYPLHAFTCAAFRRNVQISMDQLKRYLMEDRSLSNRGKTGDRPRLIRQANKSPN